MTEKSIRPDEWRTSCERFTRKHRGWLVTLTKDEGPVVEARADRTKTESAPISNKVPLQAVTVRRDAGGASVSIVVGEKQDPEIHTVNSAALMRLQRTSDGADRLLTIRSAEGEVTRMRLLTPHFGPARSCRRNDPTAVDSDRPDRGRSVGRSVGGDRSRRLG